MVTFALDTGLVVVDVQNDFADPGGSLAVAGGADIVPIVNGAVAAARAAGAARGLHARLASGPRPHFAADGGIWPVHCVAGTWGAEFHPRLSIDGPVVRKGANGEDGYSGFTMRDPTSGATIADRARGDPPGRRGPASRRVRPGDRLLRQGDCPRRGRRSASRRSSSPMRSAAVDLAPGDGQRALDALSAAGVHLASPGD